MVSSFLRLLDTKCFFFAVCRWRRDQQQLSDSEAFITVVGHGEEVVGGAEDEAGGEDLG